MDGGHSLRGQGFHIENGVITAPHCATANSKRYCYRIALASSRKGDGGLPYLRREGCSSSGEFWEAIIVSKGLPICYIIQNNQIALDTFSNKQSAETFGDKGACGTSGMEHRWIVIRQFTMHQSQLPVNWPYRAGGCIVHVETMRGCGHAHHHDDLYLGAENGNPPDTSEKI